MMTKGMIGGVVLGLIVSLSLFGQSSAVSFEMSSDAESVGVGSTFTVTISLQNASLNRFKPPSFGPAFKILGSPATNRQLSIINGKKSETLSLTYRLAARKVGRFTIPPARVTVDGQEIKTDALEIEVVKLQDREDRRLTVSEEVFIRAELDTQRQYVTGQQIILDYVLYTAVDVENYSLLSESSYEGFYARSIRYLRSNFTRKVYKGKEYNTKILQRVALFPQNAGTYNIDPLILQVGIVKEKNSRRRRSIFPPMSSMLKFVEISTAPLQIEVAPVPPDTSGQFSGAVGRYEIMATIDKSTLTTDDAVSLTITIEGTGDIKRVQSPSAHFPPSFQVYDSKVVDEQSYEKQGRLAGKKTFELIGVPREAGTFSVQPTFAFYHPDSNRIVLSRGKTFVLEVTPGNGKSTFSQTEKAQDQIQPLFAGHSLKRSGEFQAIRRMGGWWILLIPLASIPLLWWWRKRQRDRKGTLEGLRSRRQAKKRAAERLKIAADYLEAGQARGFYDALYQALSGYATEQLLLPRSALSPSNIEAQLPLQGIPSELAASFAQLFAKSEMGRFAGLGQPEERQQLYEQAKNLLENMEQHL